MPRPEYQRFHQQAHDEHHCGQGNHGPGEEIGRVACQAIAESKGAIPVRSHYKLLSLPLYLAEQLPRLLGEQNRT
jgi:hypothetical protein